MKKRCTLAMAMVGLFALTLLVFGSRAMAADTYDWKLQSVWRTPVTQDGLRLFAENVKKASKGKINIKVYSANELVKIRATFNAVQSGGIQMGCSVGVYNARMVPEAIVETGLPFGWSNWEEAWKAWTQYGIRDKVREAYAEKGVRLITVMPTAENCLMTTKPVRKVEDFKGMKIRTVGLTANIFKKLGASPTSIPGAEQYVALQRGTVSGTIFPVFVLDAYKLNEVIKYVVLPSVMSPPLMDIFMNLDLWNSLPPDMQKAIDDASTGHQEIMNKKYLNQGYSALGKFVMQGIGEAIVLPDGEVKKIRKIAFEEWDKLGAKSPRLNALVKTMKQFMKDKGVEVQ